MSRSDFLRAYPLGAADPGFRAALPLLQLLVAARDPVSVKLVVGLLGWDCVQQDRVLQSAAPLFPVHEGVFHVDAAMVQWLASPAEEGAGEGASEGGGPAVDAAEGHRRLGDGFMRWLEAGPLEAADPVATYWLRHGIAHLCSGGDPGRAAEVYSAHLPLLRARLDAALLPRVLRDAVRLLRPGAAAGADLGAVRQMQRFLRAHHKHLARDGGAAVPTLAALQPDDSAVFRATGATPGPRAVAWVNKPPEADAVALQLHGAFAGADVAPVTGLLGTFDVVDGVVRVHSGESLAPELELADTELLEAALREEYENAEHEDAPHGAFVSWSPSGRYLGVWLDEVLVVAEVSVPERRLAPVARARVPHREARLFGGRAGLGEAFCCESRALAPHFLWTGDDSHVCWVTCESAERCASAGSACGAAAVAGARPRGSFLDFLGAAADDAGPGPTGGGPATAVAWALDVAAGRVARGYDPPVFDRAVGHRPGRMGHLLRPGGDVCLLVAYTEDGPRSRLVGLADGAPHPCGPPGAAGAWQTSLWHAACFSGDGRRLAVGAWDEWVVLDVAAGAALCVVGAGPAGGGVSAGCLAPDGLRLATAHALEGRVWRLPEDERAGDAALEARWAQAAPAAELQWCGVEQLLVRSGTQLTVRDVARAAPGAPGPPPPCHAAKVDHVAWGGAGAWFATFSRGDGRLGLWSGATGALLEARTVEGERWDMAVASDAAGDYLVYHKSVARVACARDPATGAERVALEVVQEFESAHLGFGADCETLFVLSPDEDKLTVYVGPPGRYVVDRAASQSLQAHRWREVPLVNARLGVAYAHVTECCVGVICLRTFQVTQMRAVDARPDLCRLIACCPASGALLWHESGWETGVGALRLVPVDGAAAAVRLPGIPFAAEVAADAREVRWGPHPRRERVASVSPDGRVLAHVFGDRVRLARPDGSDTGVFFPVAGRAQRAVFAPEGPARLAVVDNAGVYLLQINC